MNFIDPVSARKYIYPQLLTNLNYINITKLWQHEKDLEPIYGTQFLLHHFKLQPKSMYDDDLYISRKNFF